MKKGLLKTTFACSFVLQGCMQNIQHSDCMDTTAVGLGGLFGVNVTDFNTDCANEQTVKLLLQNGDPATQAAALEAFKERNPQKFKQIAAAILGSTGEKVECRVTRAEINEQGQQIVELGDCAAAPKKKRSQIPPEILKRFAQQQQQRQQQIPASGRAPAPTN